MKTKILMHCASLAFFFMMSTVSGQSVEKQIAAALKNGIKQPSEFQVVHDFITTSDDEDQWRKIPWVPSLWEGRKKAAAENKPLFIWAMNGDPLGCV